MNATIHRADDGTWSVRLNGTLVLDGESYTVASNVAYHLNNPSEFDHSECAELAAALRSKPLC